MENKSSAVNMNIPDQRQVLPRQGLYLTEAYRSAAGLAGRLTDLLVLVKVMSELDLPFSLVSQSHGETGIGALLAGRRWGRLRSARHCTDRRKKTRLVREQGSKLMEIKPSVYDLCDRSLPIRPAAPGLVLAKELT
jgi:hypothetical protein